MTPTLHLQSYSIIASAIAKRLARSDGEEVLVASRGVATSILRSLVDLVPQGVAGVGLHSIESLAARVLSDAGSYPRVASSAERRLAMRTAIATIDDPLFETRGIAAMLERSYRDVRDRGMTLVEFESLIAGTRALRNRERTRLMANVWRRYEWLIEGLGAIDPADLLRQAGAAIRNGSATVAPQIVAGFYDLTGAQRDFLDVLGECDRIAAWFVPASDDPEHAFARPLLGHLATTASSAAEVPPPPAVPPYWSAAQYESRSVELAEVCREVAALLAAGTEAHRIAIVARSLDTDDRHLIDRFATANGFATTAGCTTPLVAQRIGRGLATILRMRERNFPRSAVLDVLRDGFRARRKADVDDLDRETRRARIAGGPSSSLQHAAGRAIVADYLAVVEELESLAPDGSLTPSAAATLLRTIAGRFRVESSADVAALDSVESVAAMFSRASRWNARIDVATILDALEQQELPDSDPQRDAVFTGDVMRFRGRTFEHLFMVRMQDDRFPQRRVEDPLIPDSDRRILGLREIGDGADEERMLFRILLDGARESIRFTWSASDGFGKSMRPSPLLTRYVLDRQPARRAELLRDFGQQFALRPPTKIPSAPAATQRQLQLLAHSGTGSPFDGYLFAGEAGSGGTGMHATIRSRLASILRSVSPTQLEDFGECPQKFLLKHILHVRDLDDPEHELQINPRDKGSINHSILEQFYRGVSEEDFARATAALPQLDDDLAARLDALVESAFDALDAQTPAFNRTMRAIERRSTRRILRQFVALDLADLLRRNLRPSHFEYRFGKKYADGGPVDHAEPFTVTLLHDDGSPVTLRVDGSIDRIDRGPDGFRIVDYKGGQALRHVGLAEKIDQGVRLQLPLYALAVAQFFGATPEQVTGAIKPLITGRNKSDKFDFALAPRHQTLIATLQLFVTAILRGTFPAFPEEKDYDGCKYCPVHLSCRTRHDAAEKYAVIAAGDPQTLLRGLL